ncbi:MAG: phosphoenolpyruvate--protein phosphotransferase [Canibacter sp.]
MVGIVAVSHSLKLAEAAVDLAFEMLAGKQRPRVVIAAGTADGRLGTDATHVVKAIAEADNGEGVVIVTDLGSALMSAEMAAEIASDIDTKILAAPFVEGMFAAVVAASLGKNLTAVAAEAESALSAKIGHIGHIDAEPDEQQPAQANRDASTDATTRALADHIAAVTIKNALGLHARPAAQIAELVSKYSATVWISTDVSQSARAVSPIAVTGLDVKQGDTVWVLASGPDAEPAVDAVTSLIETGFGEEITVLDATAEITVAIDNDSGVGLSHGRVVGRTLRAFSDLEAPERLPALPKHEREAEAARVRVAAFSVSADLRERAHATTDTAGHQVLAATAVLAEDQVLHEDTMSRILVLGETAERAVWEMLGAVINQYERSGGTLAERASDIRDLRSRWVAELSGQEVTTVPITTLPHILVAEDLSPVEAAELDPRICLGLVLGRGGPTSHTTIIARSLGIPVVIHPAAVRHIKDDSTVLIDGSTGELILHPDQAEAATARSTPLVLASLPPATGLVHFEHGPTVTLGGNIGGAEDARTAKARGAHGVGLFRTEYFFLEHSDAPTIEEQVESYVAVLQEFSPQKVVFRTLDAGSDKPLPYLPREAEQNSALGVRGIRTAKPFKSLLETQLKAIAEASSRVDGADPWVMAPMVATIDEAKRFVDSARAAGLTQVGVMIETPAAAIMMAELNPLVDFVSIGTNDLTQYTLAADRLLTQLAPLNTPWQPSVLRLIHQTVRQSGANPVSVCGEAAADPLLAGVLVGLGVHELSMTPNVLPVISHALTRYTIDQCRAAAEAARTAESADKAREAAAKWLPSD